MERQILTLTTFVGLCLISTSIAISNDMGTRESPIPIGTTFELNNGWEITVVDVIPYADDMIKEENMFNQEPDSGNQYFLAMIAAKNNGTSVDKIKGYYFNVVGPSAVAYEKASVVTPDPLPDTDIFPGGTAEGYVCWEVKSSDAGNLTMYHQHVEPYVFFSLKP